MKYCKLKSIKKIKSEDRYDFEIEKNNNFFANDILVHNCRCIVNKNGMWSRLGKPFVSAPHIFEALKQVFTKYPDAVFDGELYNHSLKNDFNQIISLSKQAKPTQADLDASKKTIQYHVYDFPCQVTFSQRLSLLNSMETNFWLPDCIKIVRTDKVKSVDDLDSLYAEYIEQGYEGQIVRMNDAIYENKRTNQLLKRKEWLDEEFEIVEIQEGKGNRSGMAGRIVYKLSDGRTFESGIRGSFDFYKELLNESKHYVGGTGTVRFFNWTPDGKDGKGKVPRFPVTIAVYKGQRDL